MGPLSDPVLGWLGVGASKAVQEDYAQPTVCLYHIHCAHSHRSYLNIALPTSVIVANVHMARRAVAASRGEIGPF